LIRQNRKHMLPTLNAQQVKHEEAEQISGEYLTENYLTRNSGCISCPIRCERRVMRDNREIKGPEYETLGLLGANLGITSVDWINEWNYQSDLLGMDTMSMGFTLSLANSHDNGIGHIALAVDDLEVLAERLRQEKITFLVPPSQFRPDRKIAFIEDPQGIRLQLIQFLE
jgi:aldehyde:ferredoxin oxidoreductase